MKAVEALLEGESGKALLVVGAPCVGKSTLARDALMAGLRRFGESGAMMTVSGASDRRCDRRSGDSRAGGDLPGATGHDAVGHRVPADHRHAFEVGRAAAEVAEQPSRMRCCVRCAPSMWLMCGRGIHAARARCCANTSPGMIGTACWPMPWPGTTARVVMRIPA